MAALPIFLLTWLGGYIATGSMADGFHAAAWIFLRWSLFWTIIMFAAAIFDEIPFSSLVFWGGLGVAAAYCLTLGGGWFIALGVVLWIISVIAEVLTIFRLWNLT